MNKDIVLKHLKEFKNSPKNNYKIEQIGVFGSIAKDQYREDSDIDIVVKTEKADLFAMVHLKDYFEKLFKSKVDIVRYRENMNPYLKKEIDENSTYV
ncbi:MAG: nucleotidyltransferase domain-containing protein [Candidatus Cloacimonetes bacterium]|nr:nucleotidyltransferase domain-containing protein [Candidatus Cloacimonadota bacterium]